MNTQKQYRRQLVNLLCGISDPKLMGAALEAILTSKELEDIEHRLQIFQMLTENTPQRQIAAKLKVGIATVTRGAKHTVTANFLNWNGMPYNIFAAILI